MGRKKIQYEDRVVDKSVQNGPQGKHESLHRGVVPACPFVQQQKRRTTDGGSGGADSRVCCVFLKEEQRMDANAVGHSHYNDDVGDDDD